jgi:hypothetical protein
MNNLEEKDIPKEVQEAFDAYEKEYAKIRDKVIANRKIQVGTIYEDCPQLLDEELNFFVRVADSEKEKERLKKKYGKCPTEWAIRVTWWKREKSKAK